MSVRETYVAALQHDMIDPGEATLVGVVRRPTGWFRSVVDENVPELGPPDDLLDEVKATTEELKMQGMCDEGAHNAAWEETDFAARYRAYVESGAAGEALDGLVERLEGGEDVALVCYEGEDKRCHRHLLVDELESRTGDCAERGR